MKVEGRYNPAFGLSYVVANFMCPQYSIESPITFYIDTASSVTTIGRRDADLIGIKISDFPKSEKPSVTANGSRIWPRVLPNCGISFYSGYESSLLEYIGAVHLSETNPLSLLGLDVLRRFSIHYEQDRVILER